MSDLSVKLGPLTLKNPIVAAAGTLAYGTEFESFFELSQVGAIVAKTLTLQPRAGNPAPRIVEIPSGMLNAVGLQNVGVEDFLKEKWPALRSAGVPVILSVAGFSRDEFVELAKRTASSGAAALELNLSCPNVAHGAGARCFAQNAEETRDVVAAVKKVTPLPVFAKLSPEVSDLPLIAKAAIDGGADVLTLINTLAGMVIDVDNEKPVLANGTGGMSGPAIRPLAVRCIAEVRQQTHHPILGLGGVVSGRDALELILAGANAVGVGTASFWNPKALPLIVNELKSLVAKKGKSISELVGKGIPKKK